MKKIIWVVVFLVLFCGLAKTSQAAEYYIDAAGGNDANAGSEAAPWQSLSMINSISSGDTVYLMGDFVISSQTDITSAISGAATNYTIIRGWPGQSATIDIAPSINNLNIQASYLEITGLQFHNNGAYATDSYAINLEDGIQGIIIDNCDFSDAKYGVYGNATALGGLSEIYLMSNWFVGNYGGARLNYATDVNINGNVFYNNTYYGTITVFNDGLLIGNNVFYNNYFAVIDGGSSSARVMNNTFYNNSGFAVGSETSISLTIKNNIFDSNTYALANIIATSFATDYNLFNNNTNIGLGGPSGLTPYTDLASWQAEGYDEHSFEGDPVFTSISSGTEDFYILSGSPAIDTGLDLSDYFTTDMNGSPRPQGSGYDVGAYEYTSLPTNLAVAETKAKNLTLSWEASCTPCTYSIAYSTAADFSANVNSIDNISGTTQQVTGLKSAKLYYWKIKSNNGYYDSDYTSVLTAPTNPSQVREVRAKNIETDKAQLNWLKQRRIKRYIVAIMKNNQQIIRKVTVKVNQAYLTGAARKVKKTISSLTADKKYKIKIRAKREMDGTWYKGKWSEIKSFRTLSN